MSSVILVLHSITLLQPADSSLTSENFLQMHEKVEVLLFGRKPCKFMLPMVAFSTVHFLDLLHEERL